MKDILGYERLYSITENGEVWSYRTKKFLKKNLVNGYWQVSLCKENRKNHLVHRLVLSAFGSLNPNRDFVNHKNGVKKDNRISNLEWVSSQENMDHAKSMGLVACGIRNGNAKLTPELVSLIRNQKGRTYTDIGSELGISRTQVSNIINKRQWQLSQ